MHPQSDMSLIYVTSADQIILHICCDDSLCIQSDLSLIYMTSVDQIILHIFCDDSLCIQSDLSLIYVTSADQIILHISCDDSLCIHSLIWVLYIWLVQTRSSCTFPVMIAYASSLIGVWYTWLVQIRPSCTFVVINSLCIQSDLSLIYVTSADQIILHICCDDSLYIHSVIWVDTGRLYKCLLWKFSCVSYCKAGGCRFVLLENDHEIISTVILQLPLI